MECFHPHCEHHVPFGQAGLELKNSQHTAEFPELPPGSGFAPYPELPALITIPRQHLVSLE